MFICFVEYRIEPEHERRYRDWMAAREAVFPGFQLYEGTDQPLLFVEVWEASDMDSAERIKKERCEERSSWLAMADWVPGGSAKIHAWTFKPINGRAGRSS
ncbi:hypothetical protein [Paenibacillus sacheonensis]|uniref:NIPSNAP domain-containing protein n=1 Tax=Paenibacillus sacheonensis TaxID=742054 RepID=A0A7X4YNV2_9BACL|nr:hypothetical protein [Paenibacillus sacheonensis]MBM7567412.1 hypothetical protein [Paenibacillus sacheonensis]NBC69806.1 hypothetical protein [Paenibacillus sacheonensis]